MIIDKYFKKYGFDDIVAYTGANITDDMIDKCMEIDSNFYKPEYAWDAEIKSVVHAFHQFCFVFIDKSENKLIGYSFWFPIKTKIFNINK